MERENKRRALFKTVNSNRYRLITGPRKYERGLTELLHGQLHWLDMCDRIKFRVAIARQGTRISCGYVQVYHKQQLQPQSQKGQKWHISHPRHPPETAISTKEGSLICSG